MLWIDPWSSKLQTILVKMSSIVSKGKLEAHEYLHAFKFGELAESAKFFELFNCYRAHYVFTEED